MNITHITYLTIVFLFQVRLLNDFGQNINGLVMPNYVEYTA